ncbi:MAG TPA: endonuclease MutS2 [Ktedonobacterales bacterium]
MHQKSLTTLEFPKIIERLAAETSFSASRELALSLLPSDDPAEVTRRLALTTEARRLTEDRPELGVRGARDVRPNVARAMRGATLQPAELLDVLTTLRSSAQVSRLMRRVGEAYPRLAALLIDMPERQALIGRIETCVGEDGNVLDSASPDLRRIRVDLRTAQHRLQERLGTLVGEFRSSLQEELITTRGGRYVLPVRADAKGQVKGIVHDQSGSGATVFIEPLVVVEMNNRLRQLEMDEQREVERILRELSDAVAAEAPYVTLAVELLADLDLQLAKARYAGELRAGEPTIGASGQLRLRQARHPLLKGRVVPIDFWLGGETRMVIVTGPNTGGKTVALKTVGLLCLMAQAGLHIPAEDGAEIPIYESIFADIGDEQSIEQSLSTFSSHMSRIIEILNLADDRCLVLLDELGAGTDPTEGAALAQAILTWLDARHVATVATTHYSELKVYAHEHPGVVNASVDFDVETLSPTYHLSIGLPGRSNALAIAARLGLPEEVLSRARDFVGSTGVEMENLLHGLQAERKGAADERYRLSMERAEAEHQRATIERERAELAEERVRILNDARAQARREVESLQRELAQVRTQLKGGKLTDEKLAALRAQVNTLDGKTSPLPSPGRTRRARPDEVAEGPLQLGDTVLVTTLGQQGELVGLADGAGRVEVQLGGLKMRVPAEKVQRLSKRQARAHETQQALKLPERPAEEAPGVTLDLRGWRVEDALDEVDTYLNDAALYGMGEVRILHGKGTGALRQAIRQQLGKSPLVKSFASAANNDGGDGVTIVTMR